MLTTKKRKEILCETERIGNELLAIADTGEQGMSWKTMGVDNKMNLAPIKSESIFSGVSGVVLFFLELYRQTHAPAYLNAAKEGMRWVENYCRQDPSSFYSFFNGRMGVSYTMLRMFDVTNEIQYLDKALRIAEPCLDFMTDSRLVANLLNGTSGTLLALLHLHAASGEEWLLEKIDRFVKYLVENTHFGPKGVYWDRNSQNISGLCGFSNGAAGIGFTLLELGRYFENDAFYWLAEQAFLYESCFYDRNLKNWPDLRKGIGKYEDYTYHENAFREGNLYFFNTGVDANNWMFGAAGIGLSRLRALEILDKPVYAQEARDALEKTIQTVNTTFAPGKSSPFFILAGGGAGCAELFLESYRTLNEPKYLELSHEIALKALAFQKEHGDYPSGHRYTGKEGNTSLFMGNPGIGYFYLRVLDPRDVPSILAPGIDAAKGKNSFGGRYGRYPYIALSQAEIKKIVSGRYFKRTTAAAERLFPRKLERFFNQNTAGDKDLLKERLAGFMDSAIRSLPEKEKECISDARDLESEKTKMDEAASSHYLLFIKERVRRIEAEQLKQLDTGEFLDLKLSLADDIRLKPNAWNWNLTGGPEEWLKNLRLEPGFYPVLLKPAPEGVMEIPLSPFTYTVLTAFGRGRKVKEAVPGILDSFDLPSQEQEKLLTEKIIEQIKEVIAAGFIFEV